MGEFIGKAIAGTVDRLVAWVVIPVTSVIPGLVSRGILLLAFAILWVGFGAALAANPAALDDVWRSIQQLPLPVQGLAWLLFLPVLAGLWIWETDWSTAVRVVLIGGIAGWNLLVFVPRREQVGENASKATVEA